MQQITAIDLSEGMLTQARERVRRSPELASQAISFQQVRKCGGAQACVVVLTLPKEGLNIMSNTPACDTQLVVSVLAP